MTPIFSKHVAKARWSHGTKIVKKSNKLWTAIWSIFKVIYVQNSWWWLLSAESKTSKEPSHQRRSRLVSESLSAQVCSKQDKKYSTVSMKILVTGGNCSEESLERTVSVSGFYETPVQFRITIIPFTCIILWVKHLLSVWLLCRPQHLKCNGIVFSLWGKGRQNIHRCLYGCLQKLRAEGKRQKKHFVAIPAANLLWTVPCFLVWQDEFRTRGSGVNKGVIFCVQKKARKSFSAILCLPIFCCTSYIRAASIRIS